MQLDILLTSSSCSRGLGARLGRYTRTLGNRSLLSGLATCGLLLRHRTIPVVQHLGGKDHVESKTSNEAVEDKLVVNFLEGGKDAGEGASEIVEDLVEIKS